MSKIKQRNRRIVVAIVVFVIIVIAWSIYELSLPLDLQLALMG